MWRYNYHVLFSIIKPNKMTRYIAPLAFSLFVLLNACTLQESQTECPEQLRNTGNGFIRALAGDKTGEAAGYLLGDTVVTDIELDSLAGLMEKNPMKKLELLNYMKRDLPKEDTTGKAVHYLFYECQLEEGYLYFHLYQFEIGEDSKIGLLQVEKHDVPLTEFHRFTLEGKPAINYLFLILAVLVPLFMLFTLFRIIRSPIKRRWLWAAGSLIGLTSVNMVWSTGQVYFQLQSIVPMGALPMRLNEYMPWNLIVGIPVVPIIFWIRELTGRNVAPVEKKEESVKTVPRPQETTTSSDGKASDPWSE